MRGDSDPALPSVLCYGDPSGVLRDTFLDAGCDAWSCQCHICVNYTDTIGRHIPASLFRAFSMRHWDVVIMSPMLPQFATVSRNSPQRCRHHRSRSWAWAVGLVQHLKVLAREARSSALILHAGAIDRVGRLPDQHFNLSAFGGVNRRVGVWLHNLPPIQLPEPPMPRDPVFDTAVNGPDITKLNATMPAPLARAMVQAWAKL